MSAHTCHWPGCGRAVPPAMWGCRAHWYTLPKWLRDEVWRTYRRGQEITKTPSPAYMEVAHRVQRWITAHLATQPGETPYRPGTGTEGACFIEAQCSGCARSDHLREPDNEDALLGCAITGETFVYDEADPRYPPEWVQSETAPPAATRAPVVDDAMVERGVKAASDASDARLPRHKVVRAILEAALTAAQEGAQGDRGAA